MAEQSMNYGGATALSQAKPNRPRFLVLPLVYCILVPWAVFAMVLWVRSFRLRFSHPEIAFTVEVVIWILALCLQFLALGRQARRLRGEAVDASWLNFVAASVLLGENLMDAGRMVFTKASYLDLKHSMGYMDSETWCVAPVVTRDLDQNSTQLVADFWAIGKNCCAGSKGGDFKCGSWSSHIAHGGLRLLNDAELSNYRLAVHQAASAFHIQVHHPIFLYWMPEPIEETWRWMPIREVDTGSFTVPCKQPFGFKRALSSWQSSLSRSLPSLGTSEVLDRLDTGCPHSAQTG
eukprot:g7057.t1